MAVVGEKIEVGAMQCGADHAVRTVGKLSPGGGGGRGVLEWDDEQFLG